MPTVAITKRVTQLSYGRELTARWPVEAHLVPYCHVRDFAATSSAGREELTVIYLQLLRTIDRLYDTPTPYIAGWHQAPVHRRRDDVWLMLQVTSPPGRRQAEVPGRIRDR